MGKPIHVTPNVHEDTELHFLYNHMSDKHYCTCGVSKGYALDTAWDMANGKMEANRKEGCCKWPIIDIAVVPHPDMPGMFMVEDRSEWTR